MNENKNDLIVCYKEDGLHMTMHLSLVLNHNYRFKMS